MAYYVQTASTATTNANATSILGGLVIASGDTVRIRCANAGGWVHIKSGTASIGGANCLYIPQDGVEEFTADGAVLSGIRESSTDATFVVSVMGGSSRF